MTGKTLQRWRKARGLTQAQLAKKAGLHRVSVAQIESGRRTQLPMETRRRLAKALKVPLATLLDESPKRKGKGIDIMGALSQSEERIKIVPSPMKDGGVYEAALRFVLTRQWYDDPVMLVHGSISSGAEKFQDFAWVENSGTGFTYDAIHQGWIPTKDFRTFLYATGSARYTRAQAIEKLAATGSWGPWPKGTDR
jgi:transcriptional regulator with XRE-family HTH domain